MTPQELQTRVTGAGLHYRSFDRTPSKVHITMDSAAADVHDLTDRQLAVIAGLSETRHYGYKVRRWPGSPDTVTVELYTD